MVARGCLLFPDSERLALCDVSVFGGTSLSNCFVSQVASSPATAAINYWFSSALSWIIPNIRHTTQIEDATAPDVAFLFPSKLRASGAKKAQP